MTDADRAQSADVVVIGGDNEAGISHGPGLGKLLAELIVDGRASRDIAPFRLDRRTATPQPA